MASESHGQAVAANEVRQIEIQTSWLNKPLPGALRDMYGRVVVPAAKVLLEKDLSDYQQSTRSRQFAYVGPDWAPADEVLDAIQKRVNQPGAKDADSERRDHDRHRWNVRMKLRLQDRNIAREIDVQTYDISVAGFSFLFDQYVHNGTQVRARFDTLPGKPTLVGEVRNCFVVGGMMHRVGVRFTKGS